MESLDTSESKFRKNSEDNSISLRDVIKNLIVVSIPHLALILIFVVYTLVGAAILKEIENDKTLHSSEGFIFVQPEGSILTKVKEQNEIYSINQQSFFKNFFILIEQSLNTEINLQKSHDDQIESESFEFINSLNRKQKTKPNASEIFKIIAKHLIQYKKQLKRDLQSNLKSFMTDFSQKQNDISKNIDNLVTENYEKTKQHTKLIENRHRSEQKRILEWDLKQSIYFIGSLVTTLGIFFYFFYLAIKRNLLINFT